jgi:hypothetical protein
VRGTRAPLRSRTSSRRWARSSAVEFDTWYKPAASGDVSRQAGGPR